MSIAKTYLNRSKSENIFKKACAVIPSGVNSPVRAFGNLLETPLVVSSGSGDTILDVDGNLFVDYCGSWGALIHGHAHPLIVDTTQKRIAQGSSFGITTEVEAKLAQKVCDLMPSIEKVRFVSSGTEATMSAVRLARGFTKRDLILKFIGNYHGHADSFLVQAGSGLANLTPTSSSLGVPNEFVQHTLSVPFNDFLACEEVFKNWGTKLACVIVEPVAANMGVVCPEKGFLEMLRQQTEKYGALLIFDEVVTGFRVALGGAQELYQIAADLTCLGKIVGGGFPAAAFGGKAEIMDHLAPNGKVYQAGTLSGNPVAMEAGLASLHLCEKEGFYEALEAKTYSLIDPVGKWIQEKEYEVCIERVGSMFTIFFGQKQIKNFNDVKGCHFEKFIKFFNFLFESGIYISPSQFETNFISQAHTIEHLYITKDKMCEAIDYASI